MEREIKFRVWDNVDYMSGPVTLMDIQLKRIEFTSDCKAMQFTGLQDKNKVDIYEGDICRRNGHLRIIIFYNASFLSIPIMKDEVDIDHIVAIHSGWDLSNQISDIEVIGNIYEHKNLLEP